MSKLLKSKFLLGVVFVAVMFVGAVALSATPAAAADCSITNTLRVGSKGVQVQCLQTALGITADGSFGPITKAAVVAFQSNAGLVADGIFGAKSRAVWMSNNGVGSSFAPAGCTNASGFSPVTGGACYAVGSTVGLPAGCTSTSGFSPLTGASCATGVVNNQTGPVTVTLASDNPASGTLVTGQATADLVHFNLTGSGTVTQITLQRTGISTSSTLQSVYLYQGATRLTDSATVNTNGVITFNGLNISVNGSLTVSVKADILSSATAGQTVGVTLTSYMVSGNTSAIAANVSGNLMTLSSGTGIIASAVLGANTVTGSPAINAGTTGYTAWSAPLTVSTRSLLLKAATFRFIGSAPTDALSNIKLFIDGVQIGSAATVNSNGYITFDLTAAPVTLNTGSHTVDVRVDIQKGSNRTFQLSIQNAGDFMVTDTQLNVNVAVSSPTAGSFSTNAGATVSVNTGSVTVTIDPTFQAATNVTGGATNTAIAKFKLHGYGEDVKVNTLSVTPAVANGVATGSTDLESLNNVALYFNGAQIGSSANWTSGAMTFTLGSSMIIPAGTDSTLEVRADLVTSDNINLTGGTVSVTLNVGVNNAQGLNSLDSTIDVPAGAVPGNSLTIATGTLAVSANPAYTAQAVSPNTANVKIGSFVLQNQSSSEAVRVTNLLVAAAMGAGVDSTNFSNLYTSETSGSGSVPINPATAAASATSSNNFSVNFELAPGATKTIDVFASTGADVTGTVTVQVSLTPTALGVNSNVNVTPSAAPGQLITVSAGTFGNAGVVVSSTTAPQYVAAATSGATNATKATYNFKSASGSATVSELKFKVTTSSGASVSTVTVNGVTAPVVSGVAYLTGLTIAVPNGGSGINVDAFMSYGPVGTNGNTSGAESFVEMTYIRYTIGGSTSSLTGGQATAVGNSVLGTVTSLTTPALDTTTTAVMAMADAATAAKFQPGMIVAFDDNAAGVALAVVEVQSVSGANVTVLTLFNAGYDAAGDVAYFYSVPQNAVYASTVNNTSTAISMAGVSVAAGGTSGLDAMSIVGSKPTLGVVDASTLLINGLVKVGSVTVAADAKGDIAIDALPLTFNSTGNVSVANSANNVVVKNAADQSTINTTNTGLSVSAGGSDNETINFTGGYTVTAGQTVTFDVYATAATVTGGPSANALSMKLGAAASLTWTDLAGNGSTAGETGTLIYNYPTISSVIND